MIWTPKQQEARRLLSIPKTHTLLRGGSRSGKTFLLCDAVATRAIKAQGSRHAILRLRFTDVKTSIVMDTWPKMMELCWPSVSYRLSRSDWYAKIGKSEVWFGGLDDKERTEKVLGREYSTIYLNEVSQIPYSSVEMAQTRLAQNVLQNIDGVEKPLTLRMYYDENPPTKGHWTYKQFFEKTHPITKKQLVNPDDYQTLQLNPDDNKANLPAGYIETILGGMSDAAKRRFLEGEFTDENPNAYFSQDNIDTNRVMPHEVLPEMARIVVGVDPSGASDNENENNDEIGIVVGGVGTDGKGYLIADCTMIGGPGQWGRTAATAYRQHGSDLMVGETNFGGAMVGFTVKVADKDINFKEVTASRGKVVRAEPFSALYRDNKIRHIGTFKELEDELMGFSTTGYIGEKSPNRADAWIWVLTELFPDVARIGLHSGEYVFTRKARGA